MKNYIKENDYKEICDYIDMYDKCYVDTWRGFSAYENIYRKQMEYHKIYDIQNDKRKKMNSLVEKFKHFITNFI